QISQVSGSAMAVMRSLPRAAPPGTVNNYSTGETQVAAEVLRRAVGRPLATYLSERIWSRVGMETDASWWLDSPDGVEIGGSGISATLRDYGRFGLFLLNGGVAGRRVPERGDGARRRGTRRPRAADGGEVARRRLCAVCGTGGHPAGRHDARSRGARGAAALSSRDRWRGTALSVEEAAPEGR